MALNVKCLRVLFLLLTTAVAVDGYAQRLHKTSWGGMVEMDPPSIVNQDIIDDMLDQVSDNIEVLDQQGKLLQVDARVPYHLTFPIQAKEGFEQYGYVGISYYVDLDNNYPGSLKDHACGNRTYDTFQGYNHAGTDIFPWPFWWNVMDAELLEVVAAAPGQIVGKQDGHDDRICDWDPSAVPNAIFILHADGSQSRYFHLKKNTLTKKQIGDYVEAGEYLGIIGSSGQSTGPHLHFEFADHEGNIVDPYQGSCNNLGESWWETQNPYYNSQVNHLGTHSEKIVFNSLESNECGEPDEVWEQDEFCYGDKIYLYGFFRDLLQGSNEGAIHQIRKPDDKTYRSWSTSLDDDYTHAAFAFTLDSMTVPNDALEGIWEYRIFYKSKIYTHKFNVCFSTSIGPDLLPESAIELFPNPATDELYIDWPTDIDCCEMLQIRDVTGRVIDQFERDPGQSINVQHLTDGMYLLSLIGSEHQIIGTKRFIKH